MKVHIIGADGQHGRDLRDRHLLEHDEQASRFAVAVPIRKTRGIIEALLSTHPHYDILSLAGLMSITPDNPRIGLIHFLFGAGAHTDLRAITPDTRNIPAGFLTEVRQQGVEIITMSRDKHDHSMGLIQALPHFLLIVTLLMGKAPPKEWKTPSDTIIDMLTLNPFAPEILGRFLDLSHTHTIEQSFLTLCEERGFRSDISTPNMNRVMTCCRGGVETLLGQEEQVGLNNFLHNSEAMKILLDSRFLA